MKKIKSTTAMSIAIAAMCALAGCSSTPGDSEVREALKSEVLAQSGKLSQKAQDDLDAALAKVKVLGCKPAESKNGFNCDWTGDERFMRTSGRIVKSDAGWVFVQG